MEETDLLTDLVVTGLAFEFPQEAVSTEAFWQMLVEGRSASTDFPKERLNIDGFYHPDASRSSTLPLRGGNFVQEDLAAFDAPFFSIARAEAECMDPQQRRLLEISYHALEDAGVPIRDCAGTKTSVYTGSFTNDYSSILQEDYASEQSHAATGIAPSMLANRISWFFDFKGTSMNLDSACSSSLVALHLACQELRAGKASMALVGGSNYVYHPNFLKFMTTFNFLSPDSRSWSFDQRANGYARGEGTAVLVVKRLADALRDGDTIRAVIRNTCSNQDGRTRGITQPSGKAQTDLIKTTYQEAGLKMDSTRFFEAHGTGTLAGDPTEANAIGAAFKEGRSSDNPLFIGAVKSNIGHLEGCSGLAGIIKTILVLENGIIPPIAGFQALNSGIDADTLRLCFPTKTQSWPSEGLRRACVNSFGFGGTNATAVLDDAYHYLVSRNLQGYHRTSQPPNEDKDEGSGSGRYLNAVVRRDTCKEQAQKLNAGRNQNPQQSKLVVWSTAEEKGTVHLNRVYKAFLQQQRPCLDQLAYALAVRKSQLLWRSFAVVKADHLLASPPSEIEATPPRRAIDEQSLAFIFTGQGAQYVGMGRGLLEYDEFRRSINDSEECLERLACPFSLQKVLCDELDPSVTDRPDYSQTVTTCLQIAVVDLMEAWGVTPSIVLGHSSGEIAAAYAAGSLSRSSAVKVAYYRGMLSSDLAQKERTTSMTAVGLSRDRAEKYLDEFRQNESSFEVAVGCVNSPKSVTLTGQAKHLAKLEEKFATESIFARRLRVPLAYHSTVMRSIAEGYGSALGALSNRTVLNSRLMLSSVTTDPISVETVRRSEYWVRNMTSTVEFEAAFLKLMHQSPKTASGDAQSNQQEIGDLRVARVLEIGPHCQLKGPIRDILDSSKATLKPLYIPSLVRNQNATVALLNSMGILYCSGYAVDLPRVNCLSEAKQQIPADMPTYPFNHSQSYWKESRLSKNHRFQQIARHDLLGARTLDWNPLMAQWRNILRLKELPWLEDHQVSGQVILPAAAMMAMAIEAARELVENGVEVRGVQLKDSNFLHPMKFPKESDTVETHLSLSVSTSSPYSRNRNEYSQFRIFAIEGENHVECCNGLIRVVEGPRATTCNPPVARFTRSQSFDQWTARVSNACLHPVKDPYGRSVEAGIEYGPCFRNIEHLRIGDSGEAVAEINAEAWKSKRTNTFAQDFAMHPSTIDGLIQLLMPALSLGGRKELPAMVPVRAANVWIDCGKRQSFQTSRLLAFAECKCESFRGAAADLVGTLVGQSKPVVYIEGLETSFIGSAQSPDEKSVPHRPLCTRLSWEADVDLMTRDQLYRLCTDKRPSEPTNSVERLKLVILAITSFILEALEFVDKNGLEHFPRHLQAYVSWMKHQRQRLNDGELLVSQEEVHRLIQHPLKREQLIDHIRNEDAEGNLLMHVGVNLIGVLRDGLDPLSLIFGSGLAEPYYEQALGNSHHAYPAAVLIDNLCFKNPSMNILEVGAGTGGQTFRTLEAMTSGGIRRWKRYDFTDISTAFVAQAQQKFQDHADHMEFRTCDISKDPVSQGFDLGRYDMVIASHVLHATVNLDQSLSNIRKLLNPGGKFFLFETTRPPAVRIEFAFGLLKDWWKPLERDTRSLHSPCLVSEEWDKRLKRASFSGIEVEIPGQEQEECQYTSIIFSTALNKPLNGSTEPPRHIAVVRDPQDDAQRRVSNFLKQHLDDCESYSLEEFAQSSVSAKDTFTVFLVELNANLLGNISAADFGSLKTILSRSRSTIWVTGSISDQGDPWQHLSEGMGRALASEDSNRKFVNLTFPGATSDIEQVTNHISQLIDLVSSSSLEDLETDYVLHKGTLQITRVVGNAEMDDLVTENKALRHYRSSLKSSDLCISLTMRFPGFLDTLEFRAEAQQSRGIPSDEIILDVRSFGLTFQDYRKATGQLKDIEMGTECSGVVLEAGKLSGFSPGDRVCAIGSSTSRSLLKIKGASASLMPQSMDFMEAASIPTSLWLAYHALVEVARLEAGETVLIHQASSCVGQMAIQIAQHIGAKVLVTIGSQPRSSFLRNELRVHPDTLFLYRDEDIATKIYAATCEMGVDVLLGALDSNELEDVVELLSPCGRLIDISSRYTRQSRVASLGCAALNVSKSSINMLELLEKKPFKAFETFRKAMGLFHGSHLRSPGPLHVFVGNEIETAFRSFQEQNLTGKRVLDLSPDVSITANTPREPKCRLDADKTYVIAGGLGGLGRSFARWMVERGARNLVLLSRRGVRTDSARKLVDEIQARGAKVATPSCDISNWDSLRDVFRQVGTHMPPVKGCVQATVALRDNLFENMTHEDWEISIRSKALGSWNLHKALPEILDFFIIISSLNGILGGRAQANYSAGNTFKDALAHHRISQGQKAVSIDLGLMVDEGFAAENEVLLNSMRRLGHFMDVTREELLALMDHYCDARLPLLSHEDAQVLVGIELPSAIRKKGIDLHHTLSKPTLRHLFAIDACQAKTDGRAQSSETADRRTMLRNAASETEAEELVTEWLCGKLGQLVGLSPSEIDANKPVHHYGIDSLAAIDLRNWFEMEIGADVAVFELLGNRSIGSLSSLAACASASC